jgi:predicted Holliday junction resolvase-like endonuclease
MTNPVLLYQQAQTILCICPCCGEIVRLSDLKLRYKGVTPSTWLDDYEKRIRRLDKTEQRFQEQEETIREIAREKGREQAAKELRKLVKTAIPGCKYDAKDIKALLHPIDFVAFCGMNKGTQIDKITLLSIETKIPQLQRIRESIQTAIEDQAYDWKLVRVNEKGEITTK